MPLLAPPLASITTPHTRHSPSNYLPPLNIHDDIMACVPVDALLSAAAASALTSNTRSRRRRNRRQQQQFNFYHGPESPDVQNMVAGTTAEPALTSTSLPHRQHSLTTGDGTELVSPGGSLVHPMALLYRQAGQPRVAIHGGFGAHLEPGSASSITSLSHAAGLPHAALASSMSPASSRGSPAAGTSWSTAASMFSPPSPFSRVLEDQRSYEAWNDFIAMPEANQHAYLAGSVDSDRSNGGGRAAGSSSVSSSRARPIIMGDQRQSATPSGSRTLPGTLVDDDQQEDSGGGGAGSLGVRRRLFSGASTSEQRSPTLTPSAAVAVAPPPSTNIGRTRSLRRQESPDLSPALQPHRNGGATATASDWDNDPATSRRRRRSSRRQHEPDELMFELELSPSMAPRRQSGESQDEFNELLPSPMPMPNAAGVVSPASGSYTATMSVPVMTPSSMRATVATTGLRSTPRRPSIPHANGNGGNSHGSSNGTPTSRRTPQPAANTLPTSHSHHSLLPSTSGAAAAATTIPLAEAKSRIHRGLQQRLRKLRKNVGATVVQQFESRVRAFIRAQLDGSLEPLISSASSSAHTSTDNVASGARATPTTSAVTSPRLVPTSTTTVLSEVSIGGALRLFTVDGGRCLLCETHDKSVKSVVHALCQYYDLICASRWWRWRRCVHP